jgi:hypothetical protein
MIEYNISNREEEEKAKNAEISKRGVKTEEGKEMSKWNALKHGILRNSISKYDEIEIDTLYDNLKREFEPSNTLEEMCIEIIVNNYIKINRIQKAELEKMKAILDPTIEYDFEPLKYKQGYKPSVSAVDLQSLELFSRYQTSAENRIYKAIMMLKGLKS